MTVIAWSLLAALGAALIFWLRSDQEAARLRRTNRELGRSLDELLARGERLEADLRHARRRPSPHNWPDHSIDRIASDVGLRIVPDPAAREAASHAERGTAS